MAPRRTISATGELVQADGLTATTTITSATAPRIDIQHLDVFGFQLDWKQLLCSMGVLSLMLGFRGTLMLLGALGLYTFWRQQVAPASTNAEGSDGYRTPVRSPARESGPRIRGIKDLPCDPKRG